MIIDNIPVHKYCFSTEDGDGSLSFQKQPLSTKNTEHTPKRTVKHNRR